MEYTQKMIDETPRNANGGQAFPAYASFGACASFGDYASFGEGASFGKGASFGAYASFGEYASFGRGASFGKGASFGEYASFGKRASFATVSPTLLSANLGEVSDALCLELMRRDAQLLPDMSAMDRWAAGGECPFNIYLRKHYFVGKRELWKSGKPRMTDRELLKAIAKEKGWVLPL